MMYPIAEAGLNKVTRTILNNAASAVVGMATAPEMEAAHEQPADRLYDVRSYYPLCLTCIEVF